MVTVGVPGQSPRFVCVCVCAKIIGERIAFRLLRGEQVMACSCLDVESSAKQPDSTQQKIRLVFLLQHFGTAPD